MHKVITKAGLAVAAITSAVALAGCGDTTVVDGKGIVEVPMPSPTPPITCYLIETEVESVGEEVEGSDGYVCVDKATYDKNTVGEEYTPPAVTTTT